MSSDTEECGCRPHDFTTVPILSFSVCTPEETSPCDEDEIKLEIPEFEESTKEKNCSSNITSFTVDFDEGLNGGESDSPPSPTPPLSGLGLPGHMARRASSQIGYSGESGNSSPQDLQSSISSFLHSRTLDTTISSPVNNTYGAVRVKYFRLEDVKDILLLEAANRFVEEILQKAIEEVRRRERKVSELMLDAKIMESVKAFVSEIVARAKAEALAHLKQNIAYSDTLQYKSNGAETNVYEAAALLTGIPQDRRFRRTPWYIRIFRCFTGVVGRVIPCQLVPPDKP